MQSGSKGGREQWRGGFSRKEVCGGKRRKSCVSKKFSVFFFSLLFATCKKRTQRVMDGGKGGGCNAETRVKLVMEKRREGKGRQEKVVWGGATV